MQQGGGVDNKPCTSHQGLETGIAHVPGVDCANRQSHLHLPNMGEVRLQRPSHVPPAVGGGG